MSTQTKAALYLEKLVYHQDAQGFLTDSFGCDSLLFSGLVGCVPGVRVNLWAAYDGKFWHRRPIDQGSCYPNDSKSTISRDMLIGVLWYAWTNRDLKMAESVVRGALDNFGLMGKGPISRTLMTPSLLSTAAWVSYKLGGPSRWWLRCIPYVGSKKVVGFQAHLQVLHLLLRDRLGCYDSGKKTVRYAEHHADRSPRNPLFLVAAGYLATALFELANIQHWPEDRLPTTDNHREEWLVQRDPGRDWDPGIETIIEHTGADYLFLLALIRGQI